MIALGFKYYEVDYVEHVIVGRGDRAHLDKLVALASPSYRQQVGRFFAPMLEGGVVPASRYVNGPLGVLILWWKYCEIV